MFKAAPNVIVPKWKAKCPSTVVWINSSFLDLGAGYTGTFILRKSTELVNLYVSVCYTSMRSFKKRRLNATVFPQFSR